MRKTIIFHVIFLLFSTTITYSQIPTAGLIAHYPFTGNADDYSGNNYHGVVNGATLVMDRFGNSNSAYHFNGISDYISVNYVPFTATPFSVSAWIKLDTIDTEGKPIVSFGELGGSDLKRFYFSATYGIAPKPSVGTGGANDITSISEMITAGRWIHIVLCISNYAVNDVVFYVNDSLYDQNTMGGMNVPFPLNNVGFAIGKHKGTAPLTNYYLGTIDDLRIYNRILDSAEVTALYNECMPPSKAATPVGATELCINSPDTSYYITNTTGSTTHLWNIYPDSAGIISGTDTIATVDWEDNFSGTALIFVKAYNGTCEGEVSDTLIVNINNITPLLFDISDVDSSCINYEPINLNLYASPNGGIFSGPGISDSLFIPFNANQGNNIITYTYSNAYGCISTTKDTAWMFLCTNSPNKYSNQFSIYPNPCNGKLNIKSSNTIYLIIIHDITGKILLQNDNIHNKDIEIDISALSSGNYFVSIHTDEGIKYSKLIIE